MNEPALDRAVDEFNAGRFHEAHEIWERLWLGEVGDERRVLEGLVRASVGYHKAEIGVPGGARKLWSSALRSLDGAAPDALGLDVARLRETLRAALDGLARGALPPPRIERVR